MKKTLIKIGAIVGMVILTYGCAHSPFFTPQPQPSGGIIYALSPGVTNTLSQLQTINQQIPSPFQSLIAIGLGSTATILSALAAYHSRKATSTLTSIANGVNGTKKT